MKRVNPYSRTDYFGRPLKKGRYAPKAIAFTIPGTNRTFMPGAYRASPATNGRRNVQRQGRVVVGSELKGVDTNCTTGGVAIIDTTTTNGNILVLNLVQQGTGYENRIGRKIFLKSIMMNINCVFTTTTAAAAPSAQHVPVLRMCIVWDKQPTGTIPVFSTIFARTVQNGTETADVLDPPRFDTMARYKILRDIYLDASTMCVNQIAVAGTPSVWEKQFREYIKLGGLETTFASTANPLTIADIATGALYFIIRQTDNGAAGEWTFGDNSTIRLRYSDP